LHREKKSLHIVLVQGGTRGTPKKSPSPKRLARKKLVPTRERGEALPEMGRKVSPCHPTGGEKKTGGNKGGKNSDSQLFFGRAFHAADSVGKKGRGTADRGEGKKGLKKG